MKQRNINLDILRCIGLVYIVGLHFFHNINFFNEPILGASRYFGIILKNMFTSCVPIFLMITGYFMHKKVFSGKYYLGLGKVLTLYGLACIPIWIFRTLYYNEVFTIRSLFQSFVSFEGYCWYVGMYIGLYCMIPFLNVMYHQLENIQNKKILIGTFIAFTSLPSLTNLFIPNLIPRNFESIYPITYYFLGAFLSEYAHHIKWKASRLFLLYGGIVLLGGTFVNICVTGRMYYEALVFINYENILAVVSSIVLFLAILKCDFSKLPKPACSIIETVSTASLQIFAVSHIFDTLVYKEVNARLFTYEEKLMHLPLLIIIILGCSFAIAYIIQIIYNYINKKVC